MFYGITVTELGMGGALLVSVCGLIVVFMMLALLSLIIMLTSKLVNAVEGKAKTTAPVASKPAAASAAPTAPVQPAQDQDELVAVLMAAIASESDSSPDSFRITNIQTH